MVRIPTSELPLYVGQSVEIVGWLHRLRRLRNVAFLILRDQAGLAQIVVEDEATIALLAELHMETSLAVTGTVAAVEQAPNGIEIRQPQITVVSAALVPPVFDLFRPTIKAQLPTVLDHAPLALRHPRTGAAWRIAAAAMSGFRQTLEQAGFTEIQSPKIVSSATESGANVFQIDYFGTSAYLAQSPQFYKQMMVGVYERVFEVGPVFRAEPHATARHLAQYTSLDAEMGFIDDHHTVMAVLTQVLVGMVERIHT
ncbi:MAG: aspartate--tRNA(Asn) ligase, partial [Anaerolineae bacterium]|nr:aspartate--tRNA(Asn) ligase [Anaerolineae bacterium]